MDVRRQLGQRGELHHDGRSQSHARERAEAVAELYGGQGVEADLGEGSFGGECGRVGEAQDRGDLDADQLCQDGLAFGRVDGG